MNRTPLQLLIVEDEAAHVEAIRRAFDQASFKTDIQAVGTLREYRERIAAQPPDLALVDLNFPDGRATEVLTHPAADAPFPILVMTAFGSHQTVVEVMKAGALDYVVKSPEAFAAMPQTVTRALREWQLLQNQKRGETALRAREHSYATLVKNISGAVYRCRNDADWTVDFISDGCLAITGYQPDEIVGSRVTSLGALMHPDDAAAVWEKCQANLAAHRACNNEYRLTHRNGEVRWVWDQAQGIYAESGELLSIEGLLTDITARKRTEEALAAATDLLERTNVLAKVGGWNLDLLNLKLAWTLETYRIHEVDPPVESTLDQAINFYAPEARPVIRAAVQAGMDHGKPWDHELPLITAKGRRIWVRAQGSAVMEDGKVVMLHGVLQDITERKQAEAALRESEARARNAAKRQNAILNALPAHIALIDPEGVILSINEAWRRFATANFLQSADCCVGRNYLSVCEKATGECSNEAHEVVLGLREVLAGRKQEFAIEYPCHSPTEKRWFRLMVTPLHEDRPEGAVVMHINVTERKQAEAAVRESESKFRAIFEQAAVGVAQVAPDGRWLDANQRLCEIVGYTREELLGGTFQDITHPDDLEADLAFVRRMLADEIATYAMEKRYQRKDGSLVWIHLTVSLVREPSGEPKYFISVVQDIASRKLAETALQESERRLHTLFNASPAAICVNTVETGRVLDVNEQFTRFLGFAREELVGRTILDLNLWMDPAARAPLMARLLVEKLLQNVEAQFRRKSGEVRDVLVSCELTQLAGETEPVTISMFIDVTERKQAEAALRESEERLRLAVRASHVGLWDWDLRSNQVVFSREWKLQLGFEEHEIANEFSEWERRVHPEDLAPTMACVERVLAGPGDEHEVEFRMRHKDGSWRWIYTRGEVFRDEKGQPVRMLGCHVDITERQRGEAALRKLARRLLRAEDDERRRIAKELHDSTAQDLVAVLLNLGTLRETLPALATESAQIIEDSVALLESSANDVRTLSYILHPPRLDETGLPGALAEYAAGLGRRADIRLGVEVAPDFGRLPDEMEIALFRVAQESLGNVVRHSGSDRATIRLAREEGSVVLEIGDFGHGMPPEMLEQTGVRGVGIAGMRERLQYLGGRLEIDSGSGGTTVRAVLPWKGHPK